MKLVETAISLEYLTETASLTLLQRVIRLKREFTEKNFSLYWLLKLYK